MDPSKTCPQICPGNTQQTPKTGARGDAAGEEVYARPYVPGSITPYDPKKYPPGAPPVYLPQPTCTTSGDILFMGPVGPWAAGHMDWTPSAGTTGVRPIVDKYSITKYSTGEWRHNNQVILTPLCQGIDPKNKGIVQASLKKVDNAKEESNKKIKERTQELAKWKEKVENTVEAMAKEINLLDENRVKLKGASRILMLPEAISKECIELRSQRYEPDLVRDDAEQELIKELGIVGEIRKLFNDTLNKVEVQLINNRAAKNAIELDWSDKKIALEIEKRNSALNSDSTTLSYHEGINRWPENSCSMDYWEHFCAESIKNCEEVRKASENLRGDLMTAIVKGGQDLKMSCDRTNAALQETIDATKKMCDALEDRLKKTLQQIADVENYYDFLTSSLQEAKQKSKLAQTRLFAKNYDRPNVENCRDGTMFGLMNESKLVNESVDLIKDQIRDAASVRATLMQYRGRLEKEIACKRKSLNIDADRLMRVRAFIPAADEFNC